MKRKHITLFVLLAAGSILMTGCAGRFGADSALQETQTDKTAEETNTETAELSEDGEENTEEAEMAVDSDSLVLKEQGMFSAGGTVITSDGTFDVSNYYTSREGSTSHVDHANVFYPR